MKDFQGFLDLLSQENILAITDDVNRKIATMPPDATDSTKNGAAAFIAAIELIGLYHHWMYSEDDSENEGQ